MTQGVGIGSRLHQPWFLTLVEPREAISSGRGPFVQLGYTTVLTESHHASLLGGCYLLPLQPQDWKEMIGRYSSWKSKGCFVALNVSDELKGGSLGPIGQDGPNSSGA